MAIVTARPTALAQTLSIDPALLQTPAAQRARQKGILLAKQQALQAATRLTAWARPLLIGVLVVSFLHLWHQIARIAPADIPALSLPPWAHWLSAALLTISVDATALYLVATRSAAQYARLGDHGTLSLWFFYVLTGALNSVFVLRYTPDLPASVAQLTPALSLLGAVLLGLLVPISIAAVEHARQIADVARLTLLVEVTTLRELHDGGTDADEDDTSDDRDHDLLTTNLDLTRDGVTARNATKAHERHYTCKRCGTGPLSFAELGHHSRRCAPVSVSTPATDEPILS
jgi:hypothetical protein